MQLVERHTIKSGSSDYEELRKILHLSKNLYNAGLYAVRQHFFATGKYLQWKHVCKMMVETKNPDYYALPTKVSQLVLKNVDQNFKSFFALLKLKSKGRYDKPVSIPKYLDKKGFYVMTYNIQAISKSELANGIIKLSMTNIKIPTNKQSINQVRVVPKTNNVVVEIVYSVPDAKRIERNDRYAAIDFGVANLAVIASNVAKPVKVNGNPLKAVNQFYNETKARLRSELDTRQKCEKRRLTSKKVRALSDWRHNQIDNYMHKESRKIVNWLAENQISVLVLGRTKGWKQEVNLGKMNNQNFCYIPHLKFLNLIKYKAEMIGIEVLEQEESYTSVCSFLDNEEIGKKKKYVGKRISRGLFRTKNGKIVNADWNAAMNILRKAIGEFQYPIEVCSAPAAL